MLAALAVERALMIALVCARHLGRYDWAGTLDIEDDHDRHHLGLPSAA